MKFTLDSGAFAPTRAHKTDAGLDLRSPICIEVPAKETLCWSCKNAVGRCSWSEVDESKKTRPIKYEPVNGWVAIKTKKMHYNSYVVLSCPEFIPDDNYGGDLYE